MGVSFARGSVHRVHAWCLCRSEEGVRYSGSESHHLCAGSQTCVLGKQLELSFHSSENFLLSKELITAVPSKNHPVAHFCSRVWA